MILENENSNKNYKVSIKIVFRTLYKPIRYFKANKNYNNNLNGVNKVS